MRIAVLSDIHGNRTAFDAVLADLKRTSPDLVFHGGDLADSGSSPAEIVDHIRDLGWPGVMGNTDEMLVRPVVLREFAAKSPHLQPLFSMIEVMALATATALGEERLAWLGALPKIQVRDTMALVHASPESAWSALPPTASEAEFATCYGALQYPVVAYGHIHQPFITHPAGLTVVNTGSVGLSYDGDPRASYLLLDDGTPEIRRVEYDLMMETKTLSNSDLPHADWVVRMLTEARFQMP